MKLIFRTTQSNLITRLHANIIRNLLIISTFDWPHHFFCLILLTFNCTLYSLKLWNFWIPFLQVLSWKRFCPYHTKIIYRLTCNKNFQLVYWKTRFVINQMKIDVTTMSTGSGSDFVDCIQSSAYPKHGHCCTCPIFLIGVAIWSYKLILHVSPIVICRISLNSDLIFSSRADPQFKEKKK